MTGENLFYAHNAQLGLVSYMLMDKTMRAMAIDALEPLDFVGVDRQLFALMYESRGTFNLYTNPLSDEMGKRVEEGQSYRLDRPDETLFKSWIDDIQAMTKRRDLRIIAGTTLSKVSPDSDADQISVAIIESVAQTNSRKSAQADLTIGEAAMMSNATEAKWADGDPFADSVETGYKGLDKATGGMQRGHITILAGMESMGKTSLALSIGLNVARRKERVYIFSMDMVAEKIAARLQQTISSVSAKELRFPDDMIREYGEAGYQDRRKRFRDAGEQLGELDQYLTINPSTGLTPAQMYSKAMMHHAIAPLDLIIFDFLGLDGATNENELSSLNASLRGLKMMGNHFNCPVLVLAQFTKGVKNHSDRVPTNDDLKGSSNIPQIAEAIWFVYRPSYYYDPVSGYATSQVEAQANFCDDNGGNGFIKIGKGRDSGRGGKVILQFHESTATFTDVARSGEHRKGKAPQGKPYSPRDQFGRN